jgi:hypothetical protein
MLLRRGRRRICSMASDDFSFPTHPRLRSGVALARLIRDLADDMMARRAEAFRIASRPRGRFRGGKTLRPGQETPLWNELRRQLRPRLRRYGDQAILGRLLGLPRQRINAFVTGGGQMPDAERTLQLLVWLSAARHGPRPT